MNIDNNPEDGEAWGRLGKLYKEISNFRKWLRPDEGGRELYNLSVESYEKAVELKPNDALWHAGFADLLWFKYYFEDYMAGSTDLTDLERAIEHIKIAYDLNQTHPKILYVLDDMRFAMPEIMVKEGEEYIFLYLTATPVFPPTSTPTTTPSPKLLPNTPTSKPSATETSHPPTSTSTITPGITTLDTQATEASAPAQTMDRPGLPFCGEAVFIPLGVLIGWFWRKRIDKNENSLS